MTQRQAAHDAYTRKPVRCSSCGYTTDRASPGAGVDARPPQDGDVSLCLRCAHVVIYQGDGVREATAEELAEVLDDPDAAAVVMAIGRAKGQAERLGMKWCTGSSPSRR